MGVTVELDGDGISTTRLETAEFVEVAELGQVGVSRAIVDDVPGTLATVGWKPYLATEDDCEDPVLLMGSAGARRIRRHKGHVGPSRDIGFAILDSNDLLQRREIMAEGDRDEETVGERVTWLLGSEYLSGLVVDSGFVVYPSTVMDANDYRTTRPLDVLVDCATRVSFNCFTYIDAYSGLPSLFFADPDSDLWSSPLRFSSVLSDIDWITTFPVGSDAELERDPSDVWSRMILSYENGRVNRRRAATEAAFTERDAVGPTSSVKKEEQAIALADRYLSLHSREDDNSTDTVIVPASKVNLLRAGMRAQFRYEFMGPEGFDQFTWWRTLETRKRVFVSPGGIPEAPDEPLYAISLRATPQQCAATEDSFELVQYAIKHAWAGAGTTITLDSAVGDPGGGNPGDLLVIAIGNRDEIGLGPIGDAPPGWTEVPIVTSYCVDENFVEAFEGKAHGALWYREAQAGDQVITGLDNSSAAIIAQFAGPGTVGLTPAKAEDCGIASSAVSFSSGAPGSGSLVVAVLITRLTDLGVFTPSGSTHTIPVLPNLPPQTTVQGGGTPILLWGVSEDGSAVNFTGTLSGQQHTGDVGFHYGYRTAAFTLCP